MSTCYSRALCAATGLDLEALVPRRARDGWTPADVNPVLIEYGFFVFAGAGLPMPVQGCVIIGTTSSRGRAHALLFNLKAGVCVPSCIHVRSIEYILILKQPKKRYKKELHLPPSCGSIGLSLDTRQQADADLILISAWGDRLNYSTKHLTVKGGAHKIVTDGGAWYAPEIQEQVKEIK